MILHPRPNCFAPKGWRQRARRGDAQPHEMTRSADYAVRGAKPHTAPGQVWAEKRIGAPRDILLDVHGVLLRVLPIKG